MRYMICMYVSFAALEIIELEILHRVCIDKTDQVFKLVSPLIPPL